MKVSIVSPVFNEELGIVEFVREVSKVLSVLRESGVEVALVLVNDGSSDNTLKEIKNIKSSIRIEVITLSRNFGHQVAVWAGLESLDGEDFAIVMDSDLQDPPSALIQIVDAFRDSADVVLMKRRHREDGFWKKAFAGFYYSLNGWLASETKYKNVGDFYGMSPRARGALIQHRETIKYIRGLISQIGFNQRIIEYDRQDRKAGVTHYTVSKMFSLGVAGITGFSIKPLIWVVYFALAGTSLSIVGSAYVLWLKFFSSTYIQPGWAFLTICILVLSSLMLIGIAAISLYLARVVQEMKQRPLYFHAEHTQLERLE